MKNFDVVKAEFVIRHRELNTTVATTLFDLYVLPLLKQIEGQKKEIEALKVKLKDCEIRNSPPVGRQQGKSVKGVSIE